MPPREILLVEDDSTDVAVALRAFRKHGLAERVDVARDGEQALSLLRDRGDVAGRSELPKVVLLDLKMPRVGGFEVLRAMRADTRLSRVPVVVLSSSDRDSDVRESYRLGANSYVRKHLEPRQPGEYLVEVARYWITRNRAPD